MPLTNVPGPSIYVLQKGGPSAVSRILQANSKKNLNSEPVQHGLWSIHYQGKTPLLAINDKGRVVIQSTLHIPQEPIRNGMRNNAPLELARIDGKPVYDFEKVLQHKPLIL